MKPHLPSCILISVLSTAAARPWWLGPFDHDGCLTQVTSMLESSNISMISNSSLFFHDSNGLLLSNDTTSPILTPSGCEQLCSAYTRPPKNSVPRLIAWLLPIMLLVTNVHYAPIGWQTYSAVLLLMGDPIDSMLSLLSILQGWNRCFAIPSGPQRHKKQRPNPEQAKREKSIAIILLSFGDCLSLPNNTDIPQNIYDQWLASLKLLPSQLDALTHKTAAKLVECRTSEMLRAWSALLLYFFQVLAAFVPAIGDSAEPSGGMIGPAMLLSWLLPMVLLSNAVGGFDSWRIRRRILSKFLKRVGKHTWYGQLPVLKRSSLPYSGGIPLYQPNKFHSTRARTLILLFLLSTLPVLVAFATAFAVLYTPPTYLTCRHFVILFILLLWLLSALVTWTVIKFSSLTAKLRWYTILAKDALIFCVILALLIGTSCGLFTSCWCLSGRWRYGAAQARVYLDPVAQFARNSGVSYPITVGICFGVQFGIWFGMMSFGWKGFGVWRWSEEEKEDALGQGASLDTGKHQQPGLGAEEPRQVRADPGTRPRTR
jgi:hypothetical protein